MPAILIKLNILMVRRITVHHLRRGMGVCKVFCLMNCGGWRHSLVLWRLLVIVFLHSGGSFREFESSPLHDASKKKEREKREGREGKEGHSRREKGKREKGRK